MLVESGKTYVRRLRARSRERDALALRLRLDGALSAMDLHPSGVPASAIVCVRTLRTRQPHASARGPAGVARSWEETVASTLAGLAARAARPAHGAVPEGAEAVLFADRAELLACLATDWLRGAEAAERWWWRGLLSARAGSRALVLGEWLEAPEHVPPALEHLTRAGLAVNFARSLSEEDAAGLLARVAHAYGAASLQSAPGDFAEGDGGTVDALEASRGAEAEGTGRDVRAAPWLGHAEEAAAQGLGPTQQTLLGVCLSLARVPHVARSLSFAREVREWRAAAERSPEPPTPAGHDGGPRAARRVPPPEAAEDSEQQAIHASPDADGREAAEARAQQRASEEGRGPGDGLASATAGHTVAVGADGPEGAGRSSDKLGPPAEAAGAEHGRGESRRAVSHGRDAGESRGERVEAARDFGGGPGREAALPRLLEARVETKLGGLFYLVNVGLFLELYGDFTTPRRPGLALPVWDFVALVGRELCGQEVCEDPVWPLLARLSGRQEDDEPGLHFKPPAEWSVPPAWLEPFGDGGFRRWAVEGGRMRLRHERGFVALDVPTRPEEAGGEAVTLGTWVGWVAGYVRARLRLALGVAEESDIGRLVCEQQARVAVTASHVDVHFRLAGLPIEVRLAGLDRDPGWVPAAGRYVAFHYE